MSSEWKHHKPPHKELVEVRDETGQIIRVRAIWGDPNTGMLPHWESEDKSILWGPGQFNTWRLIVNG